MSTDNTAIKAYTQRVGARWNTDDATQVTALTIPTRAGHGYMIRLWATSQSSSSVGLYGRIAGYSTMGGGLVSLGTVTDVYTAGAGSVWPIAITSSGLNILIKVTGAAATNITWQIAVDIMESGPSAPNAGWLS